MQGKTASDSAEHAAIRAHVALLRLQRDTLQTVIDVLERDLEPPPAPIQHHDPAPRPTLTYRHVLALPRAA